MKTLVAIIRAAAIAGFLYLMHVIGQEARMVAQQQYNAVPSVIVVLVASILFGALLRSDLFFARAKFVRVDWLSLLLIGLPSLLAALVVPFLFLLQPTVELPGFIAFFYGEPVRLLCGIVFGYTVVNSLFAMKVAE